MSQGCILKKGTHLRTLKIYNGKIKQRMERQATGENGGGKNDLMCFALYVHKLGIKKYTEINEEKGWLKKTQITS